IGHTCLGRLAGLLLVLSSLGSAALPARAADDKVIYGPDDRRDYYTLSAAERAVADSTVAVIHTARLRAGAGGATYSAVTGTPGLCASEPFHDQPEAAFCSGFLVAPDLVATAGHCVNVSTCGTRAFVFGFYMTGPSTPVTDFPAEDVYFCDEIVGREVNSGPEQGGDGSDWAVVRLDRAVTDRDPLPVRTSAMGAVGLGAALTVGGYPMGIPYKASGNATIQDASEAAFVKANLDTYGGNSGSAVFNSASVAAGAPIVEGILVRGQSDFVQVGFCLVSNQCANSGCGAPGNLEEVTRASEIEGVLPLFATLVLERVVDGGVGGIYDKNGDTVLTLGDALQYLQLQAGLRDL
ncbi:MAG: trypsin-like peptidase domain-containing protein, partial [Myxococcales bacterium]|nr:trypsin-like peptidase domain-containing protein [Myxococcales bacterium]